ncbi:MAG: protein kinase [Candidatus Schekmanbacteria bacterium]|nr:protein kinase [Candidatus Schekmanbacteria bacterium]
MSWLPGSWFAERYQILLCIKSSGMSEVYKAEDVRSHAPVVIKVLPPEHFSDLQKVARFRREAEYAKRLSHPHIAAILDQGVEHQHYYLVMEFVNGCDLAHLFEERGALPENEALRILDQVCRGLLHIHQLGVIHRDIKPQNILLDEHANVHITDFGISTSKDDTRLTTSGEFVGTLNYVSPERIDGRAPVTEASDIYSLGVVLYEALTGRQPFDADNMVQLIYQHLHNPPTPPRRLVPTVSQGLEDVVMKMLEKDPANRYTTVSDLLEDLARRDLLRGNGTGGGAARRRLRTGGEKVPLGALSAELGALEVLQEVTESRRTGALVFIRNLHGAAPGETAAADAAAPPGAAARRELAGSASGILALKPKDPAGFSATDSAVERRTAFFNDGRIVYATSTAITERLGNVLLRRGILTRREIERAARAQRLSRRRLGLVLLDMELLSRERLHEILTEQAAEILMDLAAWRAGRYFFLEDVTPPDHATRFELDTPRFLKEAAARRRELELYLAQFKAEHASELRLSMPRVSTILRAARSGLAAADLEELRVTIRMNPLTFYRALDGLIRGGVVEWSEGK